MADKLHQQEMYKLREISIWFRPVNMNAFFATIDGVYMRKSVNQYSTFASPINALAAAKAAVDADVGRSSKLRNEDPAYAIRLLQMIIDGNNSRLADPDFSGKRLAAIVEKRLEHEMRLAQMAALKRSGG